MCYTAKQRKNEREKAKKRNRKLAIILTSIVATIVASVVVFNAIILPNSKYYEAVELIQDGKYTEAIDKFKLLESYKDSEQKSNLPLIRDIIKFLI